MMVNLHLSPRGLATSIRKKCTRQSGKQQAQSSSTVGGTLNHEKMRRQCDEAGGTEVRFGKDKETRHSSSTDQDETEIPCLIPLFVRESSSVSFHNSSQSINKIDQPDSPARRNDALQNPRELRRGKGSNSCYFTGRGTLKRHSSCVEAPRSSMSVLASGTFPSPEKLSDIMSPFLSLTTVPQTLILHNDTSNGVGVCTKTGIQLAQLKTQETEECAHGGFRTTLWKGNSMLPASRRVLYDPQGRICATILHSTANGQHRFKICAENNHQRHHCRQANGMLTWAEVRNSGNLFGAKFTMTVKAASDREASRDDYATIQYVTESFGTFQLGCPRGFFIRRKVVNQRPRRSSYDSYNTQKELQVGKDTSTSVARLTYLGGRAKELVMEPKTDQSLMISFAAIIDEMMEKRLM